MREATNYSHSRVDDKERMAEGMTELMKGTIELRDELGRYVLQRGHGSKGSN